MTTVAAAIGILLALNAVVWNSADAANEPPVATDPDVTESTTTTVTPTTTTTPADAPAPVPVEAPTSTPPTTVAPISPQPEDEPPAVDAPEPGTDPGVAPSATDPAGTPSLDADGNMVLGSSRALRTASAGQQYIVEVDDEQALGDVVAALSADDVRISNTWIGAGVGLTAALDAAQVRNLRARDGVVAVERNERIELTGEQRDAPWNLDRLDQRSRPLNSTYSYRDTGRGVTAYVIDSGIRPTHVEFGARARRGAYWDFGDGTEITDCNGHGTHVAGTIGGATSGVAKSVSIVPVKAFACDGFTTTAIVVEALNWVVGDHRSGEPAVVNMSLGGPSSAILDRAVLRAVRDGITVVVSAGNDTAPTCSYSPARVAAAITVAASTRSDDDAYFSNYGACNDLFAPGVDVRSASHLGNTRSVVMSGTSMSAPHVAGAAALVLQRTPAATPARVWATINADTTKGVISECCGDPDKLLHVTPAPTRPSPPRYPVAAPANRAVRLSWAVPDSNGGTRISDYVVQRSGNGGATWVTLADGVSTTRTATARGLTNDKRYHFRVAARNRIGTSRWSRVVSAVPG